MNKHDVYAQVAIRGVPWQRCMCGWKGLATDHAAHVAADTPWAAPTSDERFEEDDRESMALCLIAAEHDFTYREAGDLWRVMADAEKGKYYRMAYNALDHIGYLPTEVRYRKRALLPTDPSVS